MIIVNLHNFLTFIIQYLLAVGLLDAKLANASIC